MSRMRRIGLLAAAAIFGAALGCGGSSGPAFTAKAPDSPAPPASVEIGGSGASATPAPPASAAAPSPGRDSGGDDQAPRAASKEESEGPSPLPRPGLGTEWGETRSSRISTAPFVRADTANPFAMTSVFYNDERGARAMAGIAGFTRTAPRPFPIAGAAVQIGLRGEDGRFLSGFSVEGNRFVVGEHGMRYTIVLQNLTDSRFECVISVDGLDVIDGQSASFSKRGYLLEPQGELEIEGFRQSMDEVAAFRFGTVQSSYAAQKHGETRNVGVIGVALFHERGTSPWTPDEIQRRHNANPFPGQFATPPGTP